MNSAMIRWNRWGREVLREGDIVFRLGDARGGRGLFALSWFIARATGSPFSHTGIVAVEDGSRVVYDCSEEGVRRMPFEAWMLECVGSVGVKRLKPEHRHHIPGVIGYCREVFEQQVPFDFEFRQDDSALYCLELTERAFRSQSLKLSEPVRIGDWEHLTSFPLTALLMPHATRLVVGRPTTVEQLVYVPGNDHQGAWASPLLETVFGPEPKEHHGAAPLQPGGISLRGDLELAVIAAGELRRTYTELPVRLMSDVALHPRIRGLLVARTPDAGGAGLEEKRKPARVPSRGLAGPLTGRAPRSMVSASIRHRQYHDLEMMPTGFTPAEGVRNGYDWQWTARSNPDLWRLPGHFNGRTPRLRGGHPGGAVLAAALAAGGSANRRREGGRHTRLARLLVRAGRIPL